MRFNKYINTITPLRVMHTMIGMGPAAERATAIKVVSEIANLDSGMGGDIEDIVYRLEQLLVEAEAYKLSNAAAHESLTWAINTLIQQATAPTE